MEKIIEMLNEMGEDIEYFVRECEGELPELTIIVNDFEGFDEDWSEIMRDYDEEAVDNLIEWLITHCISEENDFYHYYHFEDFNIVLGYSSFDI